MSRLCRKRTLLMVLLLLTGGAIINVAVAWGCAVGIGYSVPSSEVAVSETESKRLDDLGWNRGTSVAQGHVAFGVYIRKIHCVVRSSGQLAFQEAIKTIGSGWPVISLEGYRVLPRASSSVLDGAWEYRSRFLIPLKPLWPGFAINTIFYAAILWLFVTARGKFRRIIRGRRGQCPACGYQIAPGTGDVCSECGGPLLTTTVDRQQTATPPGGVRPSS